MRNRGYGVMWNLIRNCKSAPVGFSLLPVLSVWISTYSTSWGKRSSADYSEYWRLIKFICLRQFAVKLYCWSGVLRKQGEQRSFWICLSVRLPVVGEQLLWCRRGAGVLHLHELRVLRCVVLFRETERVWENWLITKTTFPSPRCCWRTCATHDRRTVFLTNKCQTSEGVDHSRNR